MRENTYTVAVLPAKENAVPKLLETLETLADATRQEHGCIEYGFYRDSADETQVLSFERWVDADSEHAHWETAHLKQAIQAMDDLLVTKPQIYKMKKIV